MPRQRDGATELGTKLDWIVKCAIPHTDWADRHLRTTARSAGTGATFFFFCFHEANKQANTSKQTNGPKTTYFKCVLVLVEVLVAVRIIVEVEFSAPPTFPHQSPPLLMVPAEQFNLISLWLWSLNYRHRIHNCIDTIRWSLLFVCSTRVRTV
jgi:hypothetical protein